MAVLSLPLCPSATLPPFPLESPHPACLRAFVQVIPTAGKTLFVSPHHSSLQLPPSYSSDFSSKAPWYTLSMHPVLSFLARASVSSCGYVTAVSPQLTSKLRNGAHVPLARTPDTVLGT